MPRRGQTVVSLRSPPRPSPLTARERELRRDNLDAQRRTARHDRQQAIDVRMHARAVARIRCVLGEDGEAVLGRFGVQRAEGLPEILIDGERALLPV